MNEIKGTFPIKKLLILLGPQGGGNHLFSKCFASSPNVGGWKDLLLTYWKGHHTEPFGEVWAKQRLLTIEDFCGYEQWVTSVSAPFIFDGKECVPDVMDFMNQAHSLKIDVSLGVISRDQTILNAQQERVRGHSTVKIYFDLIDDLDRKNIPFAFLSHELLMMHKYRYMSQLFDLFGFDNQLSHAEIDKICKDDANAKYILPIRHYWLDEEVKKACEDSENEIACNRL